MERSLQTRYLNSQDELIISLNQQIQAIFPLKESYTALQRYHIKLSNDFQSLLTQQDLLSQAYTTKINDLQVLNDELDAKKNRYFEQLRNIENQKSKLTMDRKNLLSNYQTSSTKFSRETQQLAIFQERRKQIHQNIVKTDQNIITYQQIINNLQNQIKLKKQDNLQIKNQINKRAQINNRLVKKIQNTQQTIDTVEPENKKLVQGITLISYNFDDLELKIKQGLKMNKQLSNKIILKQQQIRNLHHQQQYYSKLIESQLAIKNDLQVSQNKLNMMLDKKIKEIDRSNKQNNQLKIKIKNQQQKNIKSQQYKDALQMHLSELVEANAVLLEAMKKSCKQDEKVHKILYKKLEILDTITLKNTDIDPHPYQKKVLKQKTNEMLNEKKVEKLANTWINELTNLENR